jgi:hypothetical protein
MVGRSRAGPGVPMSGPFEPPRLRARAGAARNCADPPRSCPRAQGRLRARRGFLRCYRGCEPQGCDRARAARAASAPSCCVVPTLSPHRGHARVEPPRPRPHAQGRLRARRGCVAPSTSGAPPPPHGGRGRPVRVQP